jgi:hypothetical protein
MSLLYQSELMVFKKNMGPAVRVAAVAHHTPIF